MDAIEAILSRRSMRKYTDQPIEDAALEILLKAAMAAPSAGNQQPWHYIIVKNRDSLEQVTMIHPHAQMLTKAALGIVICADTQLEKFKDYYPLDCSAATQNMLLAAHALGIGACWLGIYPNTERMQGIRQLFSLPDHVVPVSMISMGYPSHPKNPGNRFNTERIHHEQW